VRKKGTAARRGSAPPHTGLGKEGTEVSFRHSGLKNKQKMQKDQRRNQRKRSPDRVKDVKKTY